MTKSLRPRGFVANWSPRPETAALVADARAVLAQYAAYGPMTVRQVFYRLVATQGFPKTEQDYKRLAETLQKARRAQIIPFADIRDDGDTALEPRGYHGIPDLMGVVRYTIDNYTLRPDIGQPSRIIVMTEATGMAPMVAQTAHRFGVAVQSAGGFNGVTGKHALALDIVQTWRQEARETILLHVGDHDPSGEHVYLNLRDDVMAFVDGMLDGKDICGFERIAVTEAQIDSLALPTAPAKTTDARSFSGVGGDGFSTVQAEAIDPATLSQIIESAILGHWDPKAALALDAQETVEKELLASWLAQAGDPEASA